MELKKACSEYGRLGVLRPLSPCRLQKGEGVCVLVKDLIRATRQALANCALRRLRVVKHIHHKGLVANTRTRGAFYLLSSPDRPSPRSPSPGVRRDPRRIKSCCIVKTSREDAGMLLLRTIVRIVRSRDRLSRRICDPFTTTGPRSHINLFPVGCKT